MSHKNLQVAKIYADALFQAAKSSNAVKSVWDDARELTKAITQFPRFNAFIEAPNVPTEEKTAFAEKLLAGDIDRLLRNFILMLIKKNRIENLGITLEHFTLLAERDQGLTRGTVTSAVELSDEQKQKLVASLEAYSDSKLTARFKVDPTLLGGITFKSGDLLIDNSLKAQLSNLRTKLTTAKV